MLSARSRSNGGCPPSKHHIKWETSCCQKGGSPKKSRQCIDCGAKASKSPSKWRAAPTTGHQTAASWSTVLRWYRTKTGHQTTATDPTQTALSTLAVPWSTPKSTGNRWPSARWAVAGSIAMTSLYSVPRRGGGSGRWTAIESASWSIQMTECIPREWGIWSPTNIHWTPWPKRPAETERRCRPNSRYWRPELFGWWTTTDWPSTARGSKCQCDAATRWNITQSVILRLPDWTVDLALSFICHHLWWGCAAALCIIQIQMVFPCHCDWEVLEMEKCATPCWVEMFKVSI